MAWPGMAHYPTTQGSVTDQDSADVRFMCLYVDDRHDGCAQCRPIAQQSQPK